MSSFVAPVMPTGPVGNSVKERNIKCEAHLNIVIKGPKVFVQQILLYLYGIYPVSGIGFAMLPKPVMKLRVPTRAMLLLPPLLVLVENLGLHFSQPLCGDNDRVRAGC